jgi:hypothetical protein
MLNKEGTRQIIDSMFGPGHAKRMQQLVKIQNRLGARVRSPAQPLRATSPEEIFRAAGPLISPIGRLELRGLRSAIAFRRIIRKADQEEINGIINNAMFDPDAAQRLLQQKSPARVDLGIDRGFSGALISDLVNAGIDEARAAELLSPDRRTIQVDPSSTVSQ